MEEAFSILTESETATDYPKDSMDGDVSLVTDEDSATINIEMILDGRENEVDDEETTEIVGEEEVIDESTNLSEQGCIKPNEHYQQCGPRCQQSCTFQQKIAGKTSRAICESIFSGSCHAGCFCDSGYVRFNDECILPIDCPTRVCFPNEEYKVDGTACILTCDNYKFANEIEERCPKDIGSIHGCFCKHGYVRNYANACILPNRCPPGRTS